MKFLYSIFLAALAVSAYASNPNIVILFADDMGYSDIGCYGSEIRTPNLDALAANGLRFSQFYNTGRCCPSRAAILTGLYSHQAGVGGMARDEKRPGYRGQLGFNTVTIPEVLRSAGYRTMMSGKWHLGWAGNNNPNTRGFDRFYGTRGYIDSYFTTIRRTEIYLDDKMVIPVTEKPVNHLFPDRLWYTTDVFTDYAMHFIDESLEMEKPFFLYLAYNAPHFPLHTKPEDLAKYRGSYKKGWNKLRQQRLDKLLALGLIDKSTALSPQTSPDWDTLSEADRDLLDFKMSLYAGIIDNLDQNIGRVVQKLKETGQLDNTLIFFLSDNGASAERGLLGLRGHDAGIANWQDWGRKGGWTSSYGLGWANLSNVPFRMYKQFNHEGGISTPLIAHWPAGIEAKGAITHQTGHLIDIMATCVDVAGATYPKTHKDQAIQPMAGKSLLPVLQGGDIGARKLFWEHQGNRAVRDGNWKLVASKDKAWELIDIKTDRSELRDLSPQHPEIAQRLEKEWLAWAARVNAKIPGDVAQKTARGPLPKMVAISPPITVDPSNLANLATPSFSTPAIGRDHRWSIQDNVLPSGSGDKKTVHRSWWPKKGSQEWAQYDFKSALTFDHIKVYWFHDAPNGGCKVPESWRLLYRQGDRWLPVETTETFGLEHDRFNELHFAPVKTTALRIEVTLQKGFSSGIHEWRIDAPAQ